MDKYRITLIGEKKFETITSSAEKAEIFFNQFGYSLQEAKRNIIPSFVVQEIK